MELGTGHVPAKASSPGTNKARRTGWDLHPERVARAGPCGPSMWGVTLAPKELLSHAPMISAARGERWDSTPQGALLDSVLVRGGPPGSEPLGLTGSR